jgi:hypothetical protein
LDLKAFEFALQDFGVDQLAPIEITRFINTSFRHAEPQFSTAITESAMIHRELVRLKHEVEAMKLKLKVRDEDVSGVKRDDKEDKEGLKHESK